MIATPRALLLAYSSLTAACLVLAVPVASGAAEAAGNAATANEVQEIVVTGSLFRRTNIETASPVTVLSVEQLSRQGLTNVADAVRSISADNSGTVPEAFSNGFASGSSGVALRGLTVNSTLVLIDGLRTANYGLADDGQRGFVDLNTIPFSLVQRVEVLKDGASSLYGADAIGGVVNLILKPTFEGIEANAELGDSQHGGGFGQRYTVTVGHGDLSTDRYNAYFNFEFQKDARISVGQRGFPFNTNDLSSIGGQNNIGGQPGLNSGSIYGSVTPATLVNGSVLMGQMVPNSVSQPLRLCGPPTAQATDGNGNVYCAQDFLSYGDFQPEEARYGGTFRFTVQLTPDIQAWATATYYHNQTVVDQGPAQIQLGTPQNTNSIALPALLPNGQLNPNDPFAAQGEAALINYAFGDIPSRLTETNQVYRGVVGVKGTVDGFDFTASLNVNHTSLVTRDSGFVLYSQLINDVTNGTYNFINPSANTAQVRDALSPTISKTSTTDLESFDASVTRKLYTLPGGPLSVALGGQFRYEATNDPDLNPQTAYQGLGVAHTVGNRTVGGVFFELDAPVLKMLDVDVSFRYDHYSDFGSSFSPKVGVKFTPFHQLALRGTYSEGFRAPSFSENGSSAAEGFVTYSPIASAPASFNTAHNGDAYTQSYSLAEFTVANPNIKPETSKSFTVGIVAEPTSFLNFSVDYYHITKNNVIAQSSVSNVLNAYYAGTPLPAASSVVADLPDPQAPTALARPLVVEAPYVNANALLTDGLDVDVRTHFRLPHNIAVTSDFNLTDIFRYNFTASGQTFNYVGTQSPYNLSSGAGTPKYRANWTTTLTLGPASLTGAVYYVSGLIETGADVTGTLSPVTGCLYSSPSGTPFPANCKVRSFTDVDFTASYELTKHIQLYANMLNAFDTSPPLNPANYAGGGANYNPTYAQAGIVGRFFRIGVHIKY